MCGFTMEIRQEMINNASETISNEQMMLLEAGIIEDFSFNLVQFDEYALKLLFSQAEIKDSRRVSMVFILTVMVIVLTLLQISVLLKKTGR